MEYPQKKVRIADLSDINYALDEPFLFYLMMRRSLIRAFLPICSRR